jgi:hypothetical protein
MEGVSVFAHMGEERGTVRTSFRVYDQPIVLTAHYRDGGRAAQYPWRQSRLVRDYRQSARIEYDAHKGTPQQHYMRVFIANR